MNSYRIDHVDIQWKSCDFRNLRFLNTKYIKVESHFNCGFLHRNWFKQLKNKSHNSASWNFYTLLAQFKWFIQPIFIQTLMNPQLNLFIYLLWTAESGVAMPEGTKGWTEMKTGDSEGAGQKPLSGQEPPCRKRARRMGGVARVGSRMSPEARGPGRVPGCPRRWGVRGGFLDAPGCEESRQGWLKATVQGSHWNGLEKHQPANGSS